MEPKPRRVKAKITRTVTAIVLLDKDGNVEEFEETHDEHDCEVTELHCILDVFSVHP